MSARHDLIVAALEARDGEELTPQEIADVVEDAIRDLPARPFVAVLRMPDEPHPESMRELGDRLDAEGAVATLSLGDDVTLDLLDDDDLARVGLRRIPVEVTHRVPPGDAAVTPCCGKSPFELPRTDRMTDDVALVTCGES